MELKFPALGGGVVSGLNDAGIETFEGDFAKNVVRECAQNSLDATAQGETVEIRISRHALTKDDLPFLPALKKVIESCLKFWNEHEKAVQFFNTALQLLQQRSVDTLKISDLGTTGVDGDDDDITGRWFGLVKSRGVSNHKEAGSAGAFGIGKDAPLAGSAFRTVLYSTCTRAGDVAFQGVSRLVTHKGESDLTQGTGFIGNYTPNPPKFLSLRRSEEIPEKFRRDKPGLDVWILGTRHLAETWEQPFIRSALANFWPAIHDGKIKFVIGSHVIDASSLGTWMRTERTDPEVQKVIPYYQSLVDPKAKPFKTNLENAGACRLHLLLAKRDLPKHVCLVRQTGMVIEYYNPRVGVLPFSGLFVCDDPRGNKLLKTLEPPRHDKWDKNRAEDQKAAYALDEIKTWIKEELKKQVPHNNEDQFNETEVPPDLFETEQDDPLPKGSEADAETDLGGIPKTATPPDSLKINVRTMQKTSQKGDRASGGGTGDIIDRRKREGGGGDGNRKRGDTVGGEASFKPKLPNLNSRAFRGNDEGDDSYDLILRADGDYTGNVFVSGIGDDGGTQGITLRSAESEGISLAVENGRIDHVSLLAGESRRIKIRLDRAGKFSLKAYLA